MPAALQAEVAALLAAVSYAEKFGGQRREVVTVLQQQLASLGY